MKMSIIKPLTNYNISTCAKKSDYAAPTIRAKRPEIMIEAGLAIYASLYNLYL